MIDLLPDFIVNEPRRLITLAQALVWAGFMILLFGAIGQIATAAPMAILSLRKHGAALSTLAAIYPDLPTWWVPESLLGCLPAVLLIGLGWKVRSVGKDLLRYL